MTDSSPRSLTPGPRPLINILVVEDSPVAREYLVHILNSSPEINVIGTARDGKEGVEAAGRLRPDVITMDINMPVMDGLEATRRIMETHPVPIVIVSGIWDPKEVETTFRAIEAGALAVIQRPAGIGHPESEKMAEEMVQIIKLMSEVKVVRRWPRTSQKEAERKKETADFLPLRQQRDIRVVAIGASAGGPIAIRTILSGLSADFPVPVLIVQHIASGFIGGMVEWLSETSGLRLHIAHDSESILPGNAYFAPDGFDMGVDTEGRTLLYKGKQTGAVRPSVSYLFRSVSEAYKEKSVGVLLTGMGTDGAAELKLMKDKGAVTIVQDRESSVVYGMPGAAKELDAAVYELSPDKMASALINIAGQGEMKKR